MRESGLDGNMLTDPVVLSAYGADIMTVFGLTSSQADYSATISDINFYRPQDAVDRYPVLAQALGLTPSRIDAPSVDGALKGTFSLDGKRIPEEKEDHLDRGIYVREGRKVLVK